MCRLYSLRKLFNRMDGRSRDHSGVGRSAGTTDDPLRLERSSPRDEDDRRHVVFRPNHGRLGKTMAASSGSLEEKDVGSLEEDIGREEAEWTPNNRRPVMLYAPLVSGLAIILNCVFTASGMRNLIKEALLDHDYTRFALMATVPFGFLLATVSMSAAVRLSSADTI